jgi:hypothetical protein
MKITRWISSLAVLWAATLFAPSSAFALDCDSLVVDEAGIFGANASRVQSAAEQLVRDGADVRVRTFSRHGYPNLDQFQAAIEKQCASWQAPNGDTKSNLLTFVISMEERDIGMFFGEAWRGRLDGVWTDIMAQDVLPLMRAAAEDESPDFSIAIATGLGQVHGTLTAIRQTSSGTGTTTIVNEKPADLSGLWTVLLVMLGSGLLMAFAYGVVRFLRARNRAKAMRQQALTKKNALSAALAEVRGQFSVAPSIRFTARGPYGCYGIFHRARKARFRPIGDGQERGGVRRDAAVICRTAR